MSHELYNPSVGRVVHYVHRQQKGAREVVHRPAVIVEIIDSPVGIVDLHVLWGRDDGPMPNFLRDIGVDDGKLDEKDVRHHKEGTWHWPEYVPGKADSKHPNHPLHVPQPDKKGNIPPTPPVKRPSRAKKAKEPDVTEVPAATEETSEEAE